MVAIGLLIAFLCDIFIAGFDIATWIYVVGGIIAIIELCIYFGTSALDSLGDIF